jgi:hypothetical protein
VVHSQILLQVCLVERLQNVGGLTRIGRRVSHRNQRWGIRAGRLYLTSLSLLTLEVYYRYLPLYRSYDDDQVRDDPMLSNDPLIKGDAAKNDPRPEGGRKPG